MSLLTQVVLVGIVVYLEGNYGILVTAGFACHHSLVRTGFRVRTPDVMMRRRAMMIKDRRRRTIKVAKLSRR